MTNCAAALATLSIAISSQVAFAQSPPPTVNPSPIIAPSPTATLSPRALFDRTFARLETYPIPPYVVETTLWHMHAYSPTEPPEYDALWRYAIRRADDLENAASPQTMGGFREPESGRHILLPSPPSFNRRRRSLQLRPTRRRDSRSSPWSRRPARITGLTSSTPKRSTATLPTICA